MTGAAAGNRAGGLWMASSFYNGGGGTQPGVPGCSCLIAHEESWEIIALAMATKTNI